MSAIPEEFVQKTSELSEDVTQPFSGSRKIYVEGSRPDLRVGMREIQQADTAASMGAENNPPITVYDTSGPYTDPESGIDLLKGLPEVRNAWISAYAARSCLCNRSWVFAPDPGGICVTSLAHNRSRSAVQASRSGIRCCNSC